MPSDVLGRRHLGVLNLAAPAPSSQYLLEDAGAHPEQSSENLGGRVIDALRSIHDPEIPLNIYDLGLIYRADVDDAGEVKVEMTLTSPGCPVAGVLVREAHDKVRKLPGVTRVRTELVWEPAWTRDRMSDAAKLALGLL